MADYHLIEIVFEKVPPKKISSLLKELTSNGQAISNYYSTCDYNKINWNEEKSIESFFRTQTDFGLFINLSELKKPYFLIPNCSIIVYEKEGVIGIELNFKLEDINKYSNVQLVNNLMRIAKDIADKYNIPNYYCGLEPAQDLETRLFTKDCIGPYTLSK